MKNMIPYDIAKLLKSKVNVAIVGHIMPDGDTIGSCFALSHCLTRMGKDVDVYCDDSIPMRYRFIQGIDVFKKAIDQEKCYDVLVALDCSDTDRLGQFSKLLGSVDISINIDHHISNTHYADMNWIDANAAATCELVFELVNFLMDVDSSVAEALYVGLSTDTGNFAFSNTTSKTHTIAARLIEYGADVDKISNLLYKSHSLGHIMLLAKSLETLEFYFDHKVSFMYITQQMMMDVKADESDMDGIINFGKDIEGVQLAVLFKELDNGRIKVGFRSSDLVDSSALAMKFDGGGHKKASGCTIQSGLLMAKDMVLDSIKQIFIGGDH